MTDVELLVENFDRWADDRIADYEAIPPVTDRHAARLLAKIYVLQSAKANLKRLAKEL